MEKYFDNMKITDILFKWKYHILVITLAAGIVGGAISYLVKPKYESMGIAYPVNIFPRSDESETEQVLQIFQSADIRNAVAEKQDLYNHYKIDKNASQAHAYFIEEWGSNISITRTPNDAVKIRVFDTDPQKACDIANSIINEYNLYTRQMYKMVSSEVIQLMERQKNRKLGTIDSLKEKIKTYNEMGIYDVPFQAKELSKAMLSSGNNSRIIELQKAFNEHSGDYMILTAWLSGEIGASAEILRRYDNAYNEFDRNFSYVVIVSHPEVSQKRFSPIRWMYVLLFMMGGVVMSVVTVACIEASRKKSHTN